jgi:glucokinase
MSGRPWVLLADIGGTNARFALGDPGSGTISEQRTESVSAHPSFTSALQAYLAGVAGRGDWAALPGDACLAVACPADRPVITFTNSDWVIDRQDVALTLRLRELHLINDFEAIGYAAAAFRDDDWVQLGGGEARVDRPIGVLGPGTGLGVCSVIPTGNGPSVFPGEGGHVDFAPVNEQEIQLLRLLLTRYRRVSAERLLSGAGLQNIYWALTEMRGALSRQPSPADISAAALADEDPVAVETLRVFCAVLGAVAGNLALTLGAGGGIYVAGGIVPRMLDFIRHSEFRERFLAKGRFRDYLNEIPTRIVTRPDPGLLGAFRFLQQQR